MKRHYLHTLFQILAVTSVAAGAKRASDATISGVPNFHRVNAGIYRGGQPTAQGWTGLRQLGVRTVIDLRREGEQEHSVKAEQQAVEAAGMHYVSVPLKGIVAPSDANISKVLALLESGETGPVFVHCREGVDRTGTVIACYRIAHDNWKNQAALDEAKSYGMHWAEVGLKSYVLRFSGPPQTVAVEAASAEASNSGGK
jgi:tyrosine-protein phosphatase SIW14